MWDMRGRDPWAGSAADRKETRDEMLVTFTGQHWSCFGEGPGAFCCESMGPEARLPSLRSLASPQTGLEPHLWGYGPSHRICSQHAC